MTVAAAGTGAPAAVGPAGRYRMDARLAAGAMGEVWRAHDRILDRPVAVKLQTAGDLERFRAEARHAGATTHPGLAAVHDYGEAEGSAWLVMELVEGQPLSEVLAGGPLGVDRTLDIVAQTGSALHAAHLAGIVHRDVKPANLLLRADGVLKLTDFGVAGVEGTAASTTVAGTAYYSAPEQAAGGAVTPAADVYSLGVVAYECLTGSRPFSGDDADALAAAHRHSPPPPLPDTVPAPVRDLVASALAKNPSARPADAADLARTARALRTRLAAAPPSAVRTQSSHGRALRLAGALLVVVAVAVAGKTYLTSSDVLVPALPEASPVAAAQARLRDAGLRPEQRLQLSATVAAGVVLATDPAAGAQVRRGSVVVLVVSSGAP